MKSDIVRIPWRFFIDHKERALPTPAVVKETKAHYWIDRADPAYQELVDDAQYYADPAGPDQCPAGIISGAKALLKALGETSR